LIALIINAHPTRQQDGHIIGQSFVLLPRLRGENMTERPALLLRIEPTIKTFRFAVPSPKARDRKQKLD